MGRKKLDMALIKDEKIRMRIFTNRKNAILKKANELSKLCDVDVGVILYGPNAGNPYVWPQEFDKLNNILGRYQSTDVEDRHKRATNMCVPKTDHIDSLSADQLVELINRLDRKLGIVNGRIDSIIKRNEQETILMEEVQSCCDKDQETMKMNMLGMHPNSFQYMGDDKSNVRTHRYIQEQKSASQILMAGSSSTNFGNGYMGYNGELMEVRETCENYNCGKKIEDVNGGGGMWNPTPLAWYYVPPVQLNQQQYLQRNYNQPHF